MDKPDYGNWARLREELRIAHNDGYLTREALIRHWDLLDQAASLEIDGQLIVSPEPEIKEDPDGKKKRRSKRRLGA
jgi:hypothetical protein